MALTEFQKEFRTALLKITDNIEFIYANFLMADKDEIRQEIIDGINNGTITTKDDVRKITIKQSRGYKAGLIDDVLPQTANK